MNNMLHTGKHLKSRNREYHPAVICSTAVRAMHTAKIVAQELGLREEDIIARSDIEELSQVRLHVLFLAMTVRCAGRESGRGDYVQRFGTMPC